MQTTKRSAGLCTAAAGYETLVQQAIGKVTGFEMAKLSLVINIINRDTQKRR